MKGGGAPGWGDRREIRECGSFARNGKAEHKELQIMWKAGQDSSGIIRYGDASFPSVKGYGD